MKRRKKKKAKIRRCRDCGVDCRTSGHHFRCKECWEKRKDNILKKREEKRRRKLNRKKRTQNANRKNNRRWNSFFSWSFNGFF